MEKSGLVIVNKPAGITSHTAVSQIRRIFGVGKAANPFFFKSIRKAVVFTNRNMIELYTPLGSGPVFVPHEDFGFIRDYILRRLPDTAVVVYK